MYSRAAISKQANIVNSNSLTFARALSSGNNEINNAILVDYNHVPRQYWPARFWLATVKSRDNYCKIRSPESSINLDPDFFLFFSFFFSFFIHLSYRETKLRKEKLQLLGGCAWKWRWNDWSTWYWCEIMIEYFVQFSTDDASSNILFEYQSCVHLRTVVYLFSVSWNRVSALLLLK